MERSLSVDEIFGPEQHGNSSPPPPWEKENIAQVPYLNSTSPSLSEVERDALPSLWATRSAPHVNTRPRVDTSPRHARVATFGSISSSEDHGNHWGVKTPLTAPPPPMPYETPVDIAPGSRSAIEPPTFCRPPPTPPDSTASASTNASTSTSPHVKQVVAALPGTMSSRQRQSTAKSTMQAKAGTTSRRSHKPRSRMHRWKSVFKEIFTHGPVDETQFEHIQDRHWTDEY